MTVIPATFRPVHPLYPWPTVITFSLAAFILIAVACQPSNPAPPYANPSSAAHQSNTPIPDSLTPRTSPFGIIPDWPKHYTDSPAATTVRWYEGPECPSGSYNIFDHLYHVARDGHEGQATAFAHSDGYICMSETFNLNTPDHTHLHELAHSILHHAGDFTHGHTDRYNVLLNNLVDIHDAKTHLTRYGQIYCPPEQVNHPENNPCKDIHTLQNELQSLLQEQARLYPGGTVALNRPAPTPTPTPPPTPTSIPLPTPTLTPNQVAIRHGVPYADNKFLEIDYDASAIINNRQAPLTGANCIRGGRTAWSRTLDLERHNYLIQDAKQAPAQILRIDFSGVYPSKDRSSSKCPFEHRAVVTITALVPEQELDLTGYIAEFRTDAGHLIAQTNAHDGIAIALDHYDHPEDLYDKPARLLIYDQYTQDSQPTPTPEAVIPPQLKRITFTINPQEWDFNYGGPKYRAHSNWTEKTRRSPDLSSSSLQITDAKGAVWTITAISSLEMTSHYPGPDRATFTIYMTNNTRATADFSGYAVSFTTADPALKGGGHWDPGKDKRPIEFASISGRTTGVPPGPVTIRIWDTYEPSLTEGD